MVRARLWLCIVAATALAPAPSRAQTFDQRDGGASDPRRAWLDRVAVSRLRSEAFVAGARAASLAAAEDAPRPLTIRRRVHGLFDDPTLRPGDAVMTTQGLRVFSGAVGARHVEADFTPLDRVTGPRGVHWLEFIALDAAR